MRDILLVIILLAVSVSVSADDKPAWTKIVAFIAQSLTVNGATANPPIGDEIFLKRIYMEVAGRLPSAVEARAFLDSDEPTRRDDLIDKLLESEDYAYSFFNYWADILRVTVKRDGSGGGFGEFASYLMDALRENRPHMALKALTCWRRHHSRTVCFMHWLH